MGPAGDVDGGGELVVSSDGAGGEGGIGGGDGRGGGCDW